MKKTVLIIILIILIGFSVYSNEEENPEIENLYNFSDENTTLLWYKNIEFTLCYNLGFFFRGEQLVNSASDFPLVIYKSLVGNLYFPNSIESGIRFPIKNWAFGIGLGYCWAFRSSYNIKRCYIYTEYIVNPYIMRGFELNYSQEYQTEYVYSDTSYDVHCYNVIRDLIGGGIYFKLCNTKRKQKILRFKILRFDPYLMFKISGYSVIRSTPPYNGLWDKRLTIWHSGIYAGFNFNIGSIK